jgi:hypothetical protein
MYPRDNTDNNRFKDEINEEVSEETFNVAEKEQDQINTEYIVKTEEIDLDVESDDIDVKNNGETKDVLMGNIGHENVNTEIDEPNSSIYTYNDIEKEPTFKTKTLEIMSLTSQIQVNLERLLFQFIFIFV